MFPVFSSSRAPSSHRGARPSIIGPKPHVPPLGPKSKVEGFTSGASGAVEALHALAEMNGLDVALTGLVAPRPCASSPSESVDFQEWSAVVACSTLAEADGRTRPAGRIRAIAT